jgi:methylenetetrahydrofolate dehydrogenase (NADP+) / methenyltetrahydrofolate cyclohydrolase
MWTHEMQRPYNAGMQHAQRVDGRALAEKAERQIAAMPALTTLQLVGFVAADDAAGKSFQRAKQRAAQRCGITYRIEHLAASATQEGVEAQVTEAVEDARVGGIVIQLPLPHHLDAQHVLDLVPASKDPDVLGHEAIVQFRQGGPLPPAAAVVRDILAEYGIKVSERTFAVIGQGQLIGIPVADWLEESGATVLRLDQGFNETLLREADCVVLGTGGYHMDPALARPGTGIIDFGYRGGHGDLDTSDEARLAHLAFYTPTPGGTGPMLIAALLRNFAESNR